MGRRYGYTEPGGANVLFSILAEHPNVLEPLHSPNRVGKEVCPPRGLAAREDAHSTGESFFGVCGEDGFLEKVSASEMVLIIDLDLLTVS